MKCELLPQLHEVYLAGADSIAELEAFNYSLLRRRLVDEHFLMNSVAFSAALGTKKKMPNWILVLGLSGHGVLAQEELEYRTGDTMDIAKEMNLKLSRFLGDVQGEDVKSILERPSELPYWKYVPRGDYKEAFFMTTLDQVDYFYSVFSKIADAIGFPEEQIGAYIQPIVQGVNTYCTFDLYYDPKNAEEVTSVNTLLDKGQLKLLDEGAFFSRPYGSITTAVFEKSSPEMLKALHSVKRIFDPNNVLNPGSLCFKKVSK